MNEKYVGKINYIDAVLAGILFFGISGRVFDSMPIILRIIISIPVAMAYSILTRTRFVGIIMPFIGSAAWTLFIVTFFPVEVLTKGNMFLVVLIAVAIFLLLFLLHVRSIKGFFLSIPEMFGKGSYGETKSTEKVAKEDMGILIEGYVKGKENFYKYKTIIEENENASIPGINDAYMLIQNVNQIITIADPIVISLKKFNQSKAQKLLQNTQMLYVYNESLKKVCYHISEYKYGQRRKNQNEQYDQQESTKKNEEIDESLFSGCTNKEGLTRRYRLLMKTFHPDNLDGDTEMTQKIQRTYEYMERKYNV